MQLCQDSAFKGPVRKLTGIYWQNMTEIELELRNVVKQITVWLFWQISQYESRLVGMIIDDFHFQ